MNPLVLHKKKGLIMKKIFYLLGALVVLTIILTGRALYIDTSYKGSFWTTTMTPEESRKEGLFIRELEFAPKEIYFDKTYNVIIKEAWLEQDIEIEKKIFWVEKRPSKERMSLKIVYVYKNRTTGEIIKDLGPGVAVHLAHPDESYVGTTGYENSSAIFVKAPPDKEIKLEVSNVVDKVTIVTFK